MKKGVEPGSQMHPMVVLFELMLTIHIRSCLAIKKIITPFDRVQECIPISQADGMLGQKKLVKNK